MSLIVKIIFLALIRPVAGIKVSLPTAIQNIVRNPMYNKYATPTQDTDDATEVVIGFYVEGMSSIRAQTMDFHADIYFEQRWSDPRLKHDAPHRILVKDMEILDQMWHPDLYFANANSAKFFHVTAPNFFTWIYPDGTVHHDSRISLKVLCNMHLRKYPLDKQQCEIRVLSYAYTDDQLRIKWRNTSEPITMNPFLKLPDMMIESYGTTYCDGNYEIGTWSCVKAEIRLRREIMHHVLQSYVPTILIVVISWFSFWLDIDAVPGRVSLCITTLLTLATQASSARLALPQVSYAKAIDVWMEACLGFVFGVLIEFTGVNFLSRRGLEDEEIAEAEEAAHEMKKGTGSHLANNSNASSQPIRTPWDAVRLLNTALDHRKQKRKLGRAMAIKIDKLCRVLFPLAFLAFNCIYWPYYLIFT